MFTGKVLHFLQTAFAHYLAFNMIIFSFFIQDITLTGALLGNACLMVNNS